MAARFLVIVFLGLVCLARAQNIEIPIGEHCVYTPVDAFFVMDGSASVGSAGWEQATNFMSSVIEPFDIGTDNLQVGLVRYSSDAKVMFNLNRYQNKDELLQAIKDMQWFGGVTNTGDGLLKMRDAIMDPNLGSRQGTRKVAFVITDGRSNTGPPVVDVAPTVHALGITVVAIGVGDAVLAELETIAYPSSNVLYVSDFGGLARIRSNLTQVICHVDAGWGQWTPWSLCDRTCGEAIQVRTRLCDSPPPSGEGSKTCQGPYEEIRPCNLQPCIVPINGNWGQWLSWGACSASCGPGQQFRSRLCDNPAPQNGGLSCPGPANEGRDCFIAPCITDGNWGGWGAWTLCSATCGLGEQNRFRECNNPPPSPGGASCPGSNVDTTSCTVGSCPVDGGYGAWSVWTPCSAPCGPGIQTRGRSCDSPAPAFGGRPCVGPNYEETVCNLGACSINGNWGQWTEFSTCSAPCGPGEQTRTRACDSPAPAFGGLTCPGPSTESISCNLGACSINGNWGQWTDYSACSAPCGPGEQTRTRACDSPAPAFGGLTCPGPSTESISCNLGFCPVNGNWGPWTEYSTCSTSCGTGEQRRTRTCDSPPAQYGGAPCQGPSVELLVCNLGPCAIDGNWGAWAAWTGCDAECGPGRKSRGRICNAPAPSFGGRPCEGPAIDYTDCMNKACLVIVDGNWNVWNGWTACTKSCGGGATVRARHCNAPGPQNGGKDCQGPQVEILSCNKNPCPVNGNWGPWCCGWGACSASCGGGVQSRTRQCAMPAPAHGGLPCQGPNVETQACNVFPCLVPTGWGEWGQWSRCSASCGPGIQGRRRQCVNPLLPCVGSDTETAACNLGPCVRPCRETTHVSTSACSSITGNGVSMYSYLYTVPNVYLNCQGGSVYIVNACSTFGISEYCSPLPSVSKLLQTSCNGKSACVIKRPCDMVLSGTLKINYRCTC
ncbi:SCO-spondin [Lingula anatina]|uniref:SCO-spondin n=1 Tax=Lingula anatina TaxID=7574 RepID=A0A1S3HNW8_LINAN|nr:SCO-spondin [Lingula anatina]|eukprot:XP_013387743.1 SCO-spondin [Lingula anatina]